MRSEVDQGFAKWVGLRELREGGMEGEQERLQVVAFKAQNRLNEGGRRSGRAIANCEVMILEVARVNPQYRAIRADRQDLVCNPVCHVGPVGPGPADQGFNDFELSVKNARPGFGCAFK